MNKKLLGILVGAGVASFVSNCIAYKIGKKAGKNMPLPVSGEMAFDVHSHEMNVKFYGTSINEAFENLKKSKYAVYKVLLYDSSKKPADA